MLAPFVGELDKIAPSFKVNGSQIQVLQSPAEFYETLKDKIRNAERRIFLSTLYIGKSERELVRTQHYQARRGLLWTDKPRLPLYKKPSARNPNSKSAF
jgi:phosphatidylserine/phosphatidylglycerophosphate/cardiolipin synthase-like enzyme